MENMIHFLFSVLGGFARFSKQKACSHLFQLTLSPTICVWTSLRSLEKTSPMFKKAFVWLKVGINLHIFLIYFARSKILSLRDHVTFRTWSCVCVCEGWMSFWVVFDFGFSIFPLCLFFYSSKIVAHSFFPGRWRAFGEPLLMDFINECAQWMTKVQTMTFLERQRCLIKLKMSKDSYLGSILFMYGSG